MLTPKQICQLTDIVCQENPEIVVSYKDYLNTSLKDRHYVLGGILKISSHEKLEVITPQDAKPWERRVKTRVLVRIFVRLPKAGFPLGFATKEWLAIVLRAEDFKLEAQSVMKE